MNNKILKNIAIVLALIAVAALSFFKIMPATTNTENHAAAIEQIDEEVGMVLKLTAGATGASAAISLLPDDSCTPIADELADLTTYFLVVLSALYLEKYLMTLIGYVSFGALIPLACLLLGVGIFRRNPSFKGAAIKTALFAVAIYAMIPVSVKISETIYDNYQVSFEETLNESQQITVDEGESDESVIEKFTNWISNAAVTVTDYVTGLLSKFVDSIAVMLVVSCLIPILVLAIMWWLIKLVLNLDLKGSPMGMPPMPGKMPPMPPMPPMNPNQAPAYAAPVPVSQNPSVMAENPVLPENPLNDQK